MRSEYRFATLAVGTAFLLSACVGEPAGEVGVANTPKPLAGAVAASADAESAVALVVEGEGLRFFERATGSASPLPFGRPQPDVLAALERVRGPAGSGINQDCGAGPVEYANWPDGLSLVFQDGRFAGWVLESRAAGAIATTGGIGPGSTRAALDDTYGDVEVSRSTLGDEFSTGGFYGLLDGPGPEARITDMWAGVSCVAR